MQIKRVTLLNVVQLVLTFFTKTRIALTKRSLIFNENLTGLDNTTLQQTRKKTKPKSPNIYEREKTTFCEIGRRIFLNQQSGALLWRLDENMAEQ